MQFYYGFNPQVSNATDINPLMVVSYLKVFCDEQLTDYLTEIPFPSFPFSEVNGMTKEEFDIYVKQKVESEVSKQEWQEKLNDLYMAKQLGLYNPIV